MNVSRMTSWRARRAVSWGTSLMSVLLLPLSLLGALGSSLVTVAPTAPAETAVAEGSVENVGNAADSPSETAALTSADDARVG